MDGKMTPKVEEVGKVSSEVDREVNFSRRLSV